jgi:hypothetical protein
MVRKNNSSAKKNHSWGKPPQDDYTEAKKYASKEMMGPTLCNFELGVHREFKHSPGPFS